MADSEPRALLQWNIVNWITVFLMVVIGWAVLGFMTSAARSFAASRNGGDDE